jgi:hypothetical protein
MPFDELLCEILWIAEAAHFEEGRFYEAHQVLDSSLLLRTMRPTQFLCFAKIKSACEINNIHKGRVTYYASWNSGERRALTRHSSPISASIDPTACLNVCQATSVTPILLNAGGIFSSSMAARL